MHCVFSLFVCISICCVLVLIALSGSVFVVNEFWKWGKYVDNKYLTNCRNKQQNMYSCVNQKPEKWYVQWREENDTKR